MARDPDGRTVTTTRWGRTPADAVWVVLLAVVGVYLLWRGAQSWFLYDEWMWFGGRRDLLARGDVAGYLLRPHNEHWSTIPVGAYHVLAGVFGTSSYLPYISVLVALHLTVACLLRSVMVRAGVGRGVATAAATVLLLLGPGSESIIWAFGMAFVGAIATTLAHLLLADHDGPVDRRDVLGTALALVGVATATFAVTGTVLVFVVLLVRRRWSAAALAVAPAGAVYLVWYVTFGRRPLGPSIPIPLLDPTGNPEGPWTWVRYVARGLGATGHALVPVTLGGAAGMLLLGAGAWVVARRGGPTAVVPLAMGGTLVAFYVVTAIRRSYLGVELASSPRYVYTAVVLGLPLAARAVEAGLGWVGATRPSLARPASIAALALAVGVVAANARELDRAFRDQAHFAGALHDEVRAAVALPTFPRAGADEPFNIVLAFDLLDRQVVRLAGDGLLDPSPPPPDAARLEVLNRLLVEIGPARPGDAPVHLVDTQGGAAVTGGDGCVEVRPDGAAATVTLAGAPAGPSAVEVVAPAGTVSIRTVDETASSWGRPLELGGGAAIRLLDDGQVVALDLTGPLRLCGLAPGTSG